MTEFKLVLYPDRPDTPDGAATVGFAPNREEARDLVADFVEHVQQYGSLPVVWDIAWAAPAVVSRVCKNGAVRLRAECWEGETEDGYDNGWAWLRIVEVV